MTSSEVIPELLKTCPTFAPEWKRLQEDGDHELLYVVLGAFARHLLTLTRDENYEELSAAAAFIEQMHVKGDGQVREAATIGVLEGIQNGWSNSGVAPELFLPHLGKESRRWWDSLDRFWKSEIPHVGADIKKG